MIAYETKKWTPTLFALTGTVLPRVYLKALGIGALGLLAMALKHYEVINLKLDPTPHNLIGVALGMLLVFRNNASYDRFWEGRKCWGAIVNASRNLVRSATAFTGETRDLAALVAAYVLALKQHLRSEADLSEIEPLVPESLLAEARASKNPPLAIANAISHWIAGRVRAGRLSGDMGRNLDGLVTDIMNNQGACERILRTPMPFGYVVHIRQLLTIYLLSLPWVLVEKLGWWSIPTAALIAFGLIGIEEIGVEIEDPFGTDPNDLPVEAMCATVKRDTEATVAQEASLQG
jgi:putative membrane protein